MFILPVREMNNPIHSPRQLWLQAVPHGPRESSVPGPAARGAVGLQDQPPLGGARGCGRQQAGWAVGTDGQMSRRAPAQGILPAAPWGLGPPGVRAIPWEVLLMWLPPPPPIPTPHLALQSFPATASSAGSPLPPGRWASVGKHACEPHGRRGWDHSGHGAAMVENGRWILPSCRCPP